MADSPHIVNITMENAQAQMVDASHQQLVLADFWADWCAPCRALIPILEKLAIEYDGKVLLAKVNSDEQQQLAQHFGVRSLPTVKVLKGAQLVDEFMGAQTEEFVREMIDKHLGDNDTAAQPPAADDPFQIALQLIEQGNDEKALEILFDIFQNKPEHQDAKLEMADLLVRASRFEEAQRVLEALDESTISGERANAIRKKIELAEELAALPDMESLEEKLVINPNDKDALFAFSNHLIAAGHYETAMDALLKILSLDKTFKEGEARNRMLDIFEMLGNEGPLVASYRRKMASALN